MRLRKSYASASLIAFVTFSCSAGGNQTFPDAHHGDARTDGDANGSGTDGHSGETGPVQCIDVDQDGISDNLEHNATPGVTGDQDDEDGDGFSDLVESNGNYPNYPLGLPPLNCSTPANCDDDTLFNFEDTDSDNDGLTDAEERMHNTNPCAKDTDGDGIDDLTETVAMSDPTDPHSMPPTNALYVVLPYYMPGTMGPHVHQQFTFSTRIRQADVFFLVDNSASMAPVISELRGSLSTTIVPGIQMAIPDIRIGIGSFDSMPDGLDGDPGSPGDYTLWVHQRVASDISLSQTALNGMDTIDNQTGGNYYGGDEPEDQTEAIFESVQGDGTHGHETDSAARLSVHNGLDPSGDGWVAQMNPMMDCPVAADDPTPFGWACFQPGRVPIIVLCSDANWYDGAAPGSPTDPNSHTATETAMAMRAHGALYIGIDDGQGVGGPTYLNSSQLSQATGTVDAMGNPIVFGPGGGGISGAASAIVMAITEVAGQSRQDITTATVGDPMETRLPTGHTTADFIKAVTPFSAIPDMPAGYDHKDATTFYGVFPSTQVTFDVDFYNDFQPGGTTAELFQATINVLGRAGTVVDSRPVYIIVPAMGGGEPG